MRKNKAIKIILLVLILIVALYFLINLLNKGFELNQKSTLNRKYFYNEKFDKEDSMLFKDNELDQMKSIFLVKSTYRNDIKCFDYKQNIIYYTKIDLSKDIPMDQFIWYREKITDTSTMHTYHDYSRGGVFDFEILGEKITKVNKIIFSLTGDGKLIQRNVYNKNFVSYYLPVSTFSLKYGEDAPTDIFFGGNETLLGRGTYPLMISFYKIHKSLYVLILIPDKNEMNLEGDLFGKIMNDNSMD